VKSSTKSPLKAGKIQEYLMENVHACSRYPFNFTDILSFSGIRGIE
jgi:hypothetical protein